MLFVCWVCCVFWCVFLVCFGVGWVVRFSVLGVLWWCLELWVCVFCVLCVGVYGWGLLGGVGVVCCWDVGCVCGFCFFVVAGGGFCVVCSLLLLLLWWLVF